MSTVLADQVQLSLVSPWPGLRAYSENDREYFFGREKEKSELLHLIRTSPVVVLYGQSGVGKTSILQAGAFPSLQEYDLFAVRVRFDHSERATPLARQVFAAIAAVLDRGEVTGSRPAGTETLWEFFHRRDVEFWGPRNRLLQPLIVLDQFEEAFTLGQRNEASAWRVSQFASELEAVLEHRPPEEVRKRLDQDPQADQKFDLHRQAVKFLVTLREDFLPELDPWRARIPWLLTNRFRLESLTAAQAQEVVERAGSSLVDQEIAWQIVDFVSASSRTRDRGMQQRRVEPALLSLVCDELNRRRVDRAQPRITPDLLSGERHEIIRGFYERSFEGVDPRVRAWVEDELLTSSGYRDRAALEDALKIGLPAADFDRLVDRRLLHREERSGVVWLELTHDLLTDPASESRAAREERRKADEISRSLAEQGRRTKILRRWVLALSVILLLTLGSMGLAIYLGMISHARELVAASAAGEADHPEFAVLAASESVVATRRWGLKPLFDAQQQLRTAILQSHVRVTLVGDDGSVSGVAWSRDGKRVATSEAGGDNSVRIWNTGDNIDSPSKTTGTPFGPPGLNKSLVNCIAWSSAGADRLASGSRDGSVVVWDGNSGKELFALPDTEKRPPVLSVAWSPDGNRLAIAGVGGLAEVWDMSGNQPKLLFALTDGDVAGSIVTSIAYSQDGKFLATGKKGADHVTLSGSHPAELWNASDGKLIRKLEAKDHSGDVLAVAWGPEPDAELVTGLSDDTAIIWNTKTGQPILTLAGHIDDVNAVAFSPNGRRVATASWDNTAKVWDSGDGALLLTLMGHRSDVNSLAFSPDGRYLATASKDQTAKIWNVDTSSQNNFPPLKYPVESVAFSRDGSLLASGGHVRGANASIDVWDVKTMKPIGQPQEVNFQNVDLAWNPNDVTRLAAGMSVWDVGITAEQQNAIPADPVTSAAWSPDGKRLITGSRLPCSRDFANQDSQARILDADSRRVLFALVGHTSCVVSVDWSRDGGGKYLATGSYDGTARVWDSATGHQIGDPLRMTDGDTTSLSHVLWSHDGKRLISWGEISHSAEIWDVTSRRSVELSGHDEIITGAAWSPDDKLVATGSKDHTVKLWDSGAGEELTTLSNGSDVESVAWSNDGKLLITGGGDGVIRVFSETVQLYLKDVDQLMDFARQRVTSHPSPQACQKYLHRSTCPPFPSNSGW